MVRKTIALFLTILLVLSALAGCTSKPAEPTPAATTPEPQTETEPAATAPAEAEPAKDDKYGGNLIYVNATVSTSLDPHFNTSSQGNYQWMQNVFEAPLCHSDTGEIYPLVCDYDLSDDGLVLKLTVRDYYFSNGQKVTIEDVLASLERCALTSSGFANNTWAYVSDKTIEGDTLTLTFSQVLAPLLWTFSSQYGCYITTKEICEKYGDQQFTDMADVIGTGPYVLKEYTPDIKVVVERNENYVPTMNDATGPAAPRMAYQDTITYAVNGDEASRTAGLIAGDYHIGTILASMREYANQIGLKMHLIDAQWIHGIKFNISPKNADSPIANVNVRKAIRAVLNSEAALVAALQSEDKDRYALDPGPIAATNKTYHNTIIADNEWNICDKELGKKYLEEAGYNGEEIVWLVSAGSIYNRIATVEIPLLEEVGLNVTLRAVDRGSVAGIRTDPAGGWDIAYFDYQKATYNPITNAGMTYSSAFGFWDTERHTEVFNALNSTPTGSPESIKAYEDFCWAVVDEVPYVPFGNYKSVYFTQPNVEWDFQGIEQYLWNAYFID